MRETKKFYLFIFILMVVGLCGKSALAQQYVAATNDYGDRLEITGFEPQIPATLMIGNRLNVKVAYQIQSATDCRIWVRPFVNGKGPVGYYYSPSPLYKNGSGELTGWFFFIEPVHVDKVYVNMFCDGNTILDLTADIDATWTKPPNP